MPSNFRTYLAEFLGTFLLVVGGVGAAVLAGHFIGLLGTSLAFGFTLMFLVYALGPISGCHVNPAVTLGLFLARKFPSSQVLPYIIAQLLGAILGATAIYLIASGKANFNLHDGFAANGFGANSPSGHNAIAAFIAETVLMALLIFVVLSTTRPNFSVGFEGLAIGIVVVVIHLVSIPVTNTSVNFARSLGTAIFAGGPFLAQLWLFGVAHVLAAFLAVGAHQVLTPRE